MKQRVALSQIFLLSFLSLPLAFVGIPIYLNIADFYARNFGLNLALIGALLTAIRLIDIFCDPLIGYFSDKLSQKNFGRKRLIYFSSTFLVLSFYFVFNPPRTLNQSFAVAWFFVSLTLTYFFFSITIINFESLIAISAKNDKERVRINSIKEFLGMIGMILAFLIPAFLTNFFGIDQNLEYLVLSCCFAVLVAVAVILFLRKVQIAEIEKSSAEPADKGFHEVFRNKKVLALFVIFLINGVAVSLPAANLNFYVRDVLGRENEQGWFLAVYFISACFFMPFWGVVAAKFGAIKTWIFSILGSVLTFFFAYFLGQKSAGYFYLICAFSGLFLGPDLITPPALLANITAKNKSLTSSYFSIWNFVSKTSLMIAASGSLITLGYFGYEPRKFLEPSALNIISFLYALLPCIIKILTIFFLALFTKKFLSNENH